MKRGGGKILDFPLAIVLLALLASISGCAGTQKQSVLPSGVPDAISVVFIETKTTADSNEIDLLQRITGAMSSNLIVDLNQQGFRGTLIRAEKDFSREGHLLKASIISQRIVSTGARIAVGKLAGVDSLKAHYDLIDANGNEVLAWEDEQSSLFGGPDKCTAVLSRNAAEKIALHFGAR